MLLKLVVCFILLAFNSSLAVDEVRKESSFVFILPQVVQYGRSNTACLSLQNVALPVNVSVELEINSLKQTLTERTVEKDNSCFKIPIPHINETDQSQATTEIKIQANGLKLQGSNRRPLVTSPYTNQKITILQTDRQMYKPGDILKIRILLLNKEFLSGANQTIPEVKIKNPNDVTVVVWNNVTTEQGLAHLEYQLSDETVEGQWTIEANGEIKTVEIKKYVLPRFKVELIHPEEIYIKAKQVEFQVCAKYPYGQPVKGTVKLNISRTQTYYWYVEEIPFKNITKIEKLNSTCAKFLIPAEELNIVNKERWWWWRLEAQATVTEAGTNQSEQAHKELRLTPQPLLLEIDAEEDAFRTGLPYNAVVKFKNIQAPLQNETLQICYDLIDSADGWKTLQTSCSNFTADIESGVPFTIPPLVSNISQVQIRANCCGADTAYKGLHRILSISKNYIYLRQNKSDSLKCRRVQQFTVYYTTNDTNIYNDLKLYYMVKANNRIYLSEEVNVQPKNFQTVEPNSLKNVPGSPNSNYTNYNSKIASFNISFSLDPLILSKYELLVYSLLPNGEIVVGTKEVEQDKPCLPNKVDMEWSKSTFQPNEEATLKIKTSPKSLCSLSAVDEATKFRSNDNFDVKTFVERLTQYDFPHYYYYYYYDNPCPDSIYQQNNDSTYWEPEVYSDKDTHQMLEELGVSVITNLNITRKPCIKREIHLYWSSDGDRRYELESDMIGGSPGIGYAVDSIAPRTTHLLRSEASAYQPKLGVPVSSLKETNSNAVPIRSFFPETWLWELIPINSNGEAELVKNVPHSITNWVSSAICMSPTDGVGMSDTKSLITFQSFFIDVVVPYSIKRKEILHLVIKVFNYMNYTLPVQVSILQQDGLEVLDALAGVTKCVDSSDSEDFVYKIKSMEIGKLNITVIGEVDASHKDRCELAHKLERRDVVRKSLLVEPEGFPVEKVQSELLCANGTHPKELVWRLQLPHDSNLVSDSARSKVIFNSDILGSTIDNLERLLVIPTGCGEQVMSTLAPNLHVLRYLNATNRLTADLRNRAVENIKIGYQKILTYMHKDGSFSAFGESDGSGSMFLTTFVIKTLVQAKPYIYVDDSIVNKSVGWIFEHQLENGCFPPLNHLFHRLGDEAESNVVLTAYVLISLKEANIEIPDNIIKKSISCISNYNESSNYPLVLTAYALHLTGNKNEGIKRLNTVLKNLPSLMSNRGERYYYSSNDIEIYGYALLSLLLHNDTNSIAEASSLVQKLSTKMSPRGGFASTQDTVVALDALSKYSVVVSEKPNISLHFTATGQEKDFNININDQIKVVTYPLKQAEDTVHLKIQGKGCVLAQAVLTYNVYSLTQKPAFNVSVRNEANPDSRRCIETNLTACVLYNNPGKSNMVVMEVGIPSGYRADEQSLALYLEKHNQDNKIKRFELDKNNVVLYFVGLTMEETCVSLDIAETQTVENRTASTVNVFDYYKPEDRTTLLYELSGCE